MLSTCFFLILKIDLESKLHEADKAGARLKLIATDGVFSMDGEIAPLDKICDLAEKYNALVFVDDCHSTGFLGPNGRGTAEYYGVQDRVHIINSTLGKALGGAAGGYTTGCKEMIDLLRNRSRPYLFSNSLPPAVVGSASAALDLIEGAKTNGLFDQLWGNTKLFRKLLTDAGFTIKVRQDASTKHPTSFDGGTNSIVLILCKNREATILSLLSCWATPVWLASLLKRCFSAASMLLAFRFPWYPKVKPASVFRSPRPTAKSRSAVLLPPSSRLARSWASLAPRASCK